MSIPFENLLEHVLSFGNQRWLEIQDFLDGSFQFDTVQRIDIQVGFFHFGQKSGSLSVSVNALRNISTRSFGVLGGRT